MSDIVRGTVKLSDPTKGCQQLQLELLEDETQDEVECYEQFGVSFRPTDDAEVLALRLGGSQMNLTAIGTAGRGQRPTVEIEKGEGGLYFAGTFKVFLRSDGKVLLGSKDATDFAALSSKVEAELNKIKAAINGAPTSPGDGGAGFKAAIMTALNSSGMGAAGSTAAVNTIVD